MVKAGKFGHRAIEFAMDQRLSEYGANSPIKRLWWGTVTKRTGVAASQRLNVRGPTWGFEWIEYAEIYSRSFHQGGTYAGAVAPTIQHYFNKNPTLALGATLGTETKSILLRIWGR